MTISSTKFPEGIVVKQGSKYSVYIIGSIYTKDRVHKTVADAKKSANRRVIVARLEGKKCILKTKGDRFAVYFCERTHMDKPAAESYARGPHGKMKMR